MRLSLHTDVAGSNSFEFKGKVKGKKLKKGKYVLVAVPSAGGLTGASASVRSGSAERQRPPHPC